MKSLFILMALAAAIGVISGIGSSCTTFNLLGNWWKMPNDKGGYTFAIIGTNQPAFIASYIVTWLVAIVWVALYWALREKKSWFYNVAIINSVAGIISGIIPVWILFYEWWATYGVNGMPFTPSWARVIGNLFLLIVLLLSGTRRNLEAHMAEETGTGGGSIGSQVAYFSTVALSFGVLLIIQPIIMPITHPIDASVYTFTGNWLEAFQYFIGFLSIVVGIFLRFVGQIIKSIHTPKPTPA